MKRIINESNWKGEKYIMEWFSETNYESLANITQIYGVEFDKEGKICLIALAGEPTWSLMGGEIEKGKTWKQTLIENAKKLADIELDEKSIIPLGYIKVTPKNKDNPLGVHYLLRVAGKILKVNEQPKDKYGGTPNERVFISLDEFPRYCPWGKMGQALMDKAKDAQQNFK